MTTYPYSSARLSRPNAPQLKQPVNKPQVTNRMGAIQRRLQQVQGSNRSKPGSNTRPY